MRDVVDVRALDPAMDAEWFERFLQEEWGGPLQARRGELLDVRSLPGLVAEREGEWVGVLWYRDCGDGEWELALIGARAPGNGVGSALVDALVERVGPGNRIWVVTTNDNVDALRFYQRRGFSLRALRVGAVDEARRDLKPGIPALGRYGIAVRDELELELVV
jgi:ribosomal protein S18 acetylase RimI-like enzyme